MLFLSGFKKNLYTIAKNIVLLKEEGETEKFANKADFFGYPCLKIVARGENDYVCLPKQAEAFSGGKYLFCDEGILSQLFPGKKVFPLKNDIYVFGGEESVTFFEVNRAEEKRYYTYLALFSAYTAERDRKVATRQRKILTSRSYDLLCAEISKKDNPSYAPYASNLPLYPPLFGFPDDFIYNLFKQPEETVCFPKGGVWKGLLPFLVERGVKRIVLPKTADEKNFFVPVGEKKVEIYFENILTGEKKAVYTLLEGYRQYPKIQQPVFEEIKAENGTFPPLPLPVLLPTVQGQITDDGEPIKLKAGAHEIENGALRVVEKNGAFLLGSDLLSIDYFTGKYHRCGTVSLRSYISGRFALFEGHYYYRSATARVRVMLESEKDRLYVDFVGDENFVLACKKKGVKSVLCALPFGEEEGMAENGLFRARDRIVLRSDREEISFLSTDIECKKEEDTFYIPFRSSSGKKTIVIKKSTSV